MLVGRRFIVRGRVQRVGFRYFVEDAAQREGIQGYARNQHDGSVEVVAEGEIDAMQRFEMAVRRGPSGARVENVDTSDVEPSNRFAGFRVTG
ncbi:MAG TPA: acylphosphatase [Vicinamibacterales bacterium]|nr:acylphosphatase [Vicinamibacterales bacterium]